MDIEIKPRNRRLKKYILPAAGIAVAVGLSIWALVSAQESTYRTDRMAIVIEEVTEGQFDDYIRVAGRVEPATTVQIAALETGIVETKWLEEGAMVNEGDIIVTLRNPNLQQQILDSESQLAERQNMLRDTEITMEKERLQIRQDLLAARTDMNRKQRLYEQQKTLYDEHLTSREEYLKAREDYELARESLQLLRERQRQDSLYRSVQIGMMRESLDNMQQNFRLVRQRADNLNIRATHSGQLGSLTPALGQNVMAGEQIGQINMLDSYRLTVNIDEHYIDRVSKGLTGRAERNGNKLRLTVTKVYPEVVDGHFRTDMEIDGEENTNLRVGQTYPVDLQLGSPQQAVMVPRGSFFQSTGGKWVYVVADDGHSAVKRDINIGRQNPRYYEVTGGLRPGEHIITSSYADFGEADRIILKD